jgi:hypothetical protein
MIGEPDAGNPHVQFDEGVQKTCGSVTRLCPTRPASPVVESERFPYLCGVRVMMAAHRRRCAGERE